jgi:hypothetical protein
MQDISINDVAAQVTEQKRYFDHVARDCLPVVQSSVDELRKMKRRATSLLRRRLWALESSKAEVTLNRQPRMLNKMEQWINQHPDAVFNVIKFEPSALRTWVRANRLTQPRAEACLRQFYHDDGNVQTQVFFPSSFARGFDLVTHQYSYCYVGFRNSADRAIAKLAMHSEIPF